MNDSANLFRATQTEEKLRRNEVQGKRQATSDKRIKPIMKSDVKFENPQKSLAALCRKTYPHQSKVLNKLNPLLVNMSRVFIRMMRNNHER